MNRYHDLREDEELQTNAQLERLMMELRAGELREWDFKRFNNMSASVDRETFTRLCSWAVYTKEWINSLTKLLQGKRIVEVCAGRGVLAPIMEKRRFDWTCTDPYPPKGVTHVLEKGSVEAANELRPDVIFASWIPMDVEFDYELAQMGFPMVIVGEGWGGCTGGKKFWGNAYDEDDGIPRNYEMLDAPRWFRDVPSWFGIHDYTRLVIPKMTKLEDFFNVGI